MGILLMSVVREIIAKTVLHIQEWVLKSFFFFLAQYASQEDIFVKGFLGWSKNFSAPPYMQVIFSNRIKLPIYT